MENPNIRPNIKKQWFRGLLVIQGTAVPSTQFVSESHSLFRGEIVITEITDRECFF